MALYSLIVLMCHKRLLTHLIDVVCLCVSLCLCMSVCICLYVSVYLFRDLFGVDMGAISHHILCIYRWSYTRRYFRLHRHYQANTCVLAANLTRFDCFCSRICANIQFTSVPCVLSVVSAVKLL